MTRTASWSTSAILRAGPGAGVLRPRQPEPLAGAGGGGACTNRRTARNFTLVLRPVSAPRRVLERGRRRACAFRSLAGYFSFVFSKCPVARFFLTSCQAKQRPFMTT